MNSQEAFERYIKKDKGIKVPLALSETGHYQHTLTYELWQTWQAAQPQWQPISTAPTDGTEVLAWREDCGIFIASYTSLDSFPMSQSEIEDLDEEYLFSKDWFTQWPQSLRLEGSEAPTHWQPLPEPPKESSE